MVECDGVAVVGNLPGNNRVVLQGDASGDGLFDLEMEGLRAIVPAEDASSDATSNNWTRYQREDPSQPRRVERGTRLRGVLGKVRTFKYLLGQAAGDWPPGRGASSACRAWSFHPLPDVGPSSPFKPSRHLSPNKQPLTSPVLGFETLDGNTIFSTVTNQARRITSKSRLNSRQQHIPVPSPTRAPPNTVKMFMARSEYGTSLLYAIFVCHCKLGVMPLEWTSYTRHHGLTANILARIQIGVLSK